MSSQAMTAALNLSQELTADEFRLLILIAELSTDHEGWLVVSWGKVLEKCGLTERQCGRMLRGLQIDLLIAVNTDNWALQMSVGDPRCSIPVEPSVCIWIEGMIKPGENRPPRYFYRKHPIPRSIRDQIFERDNYTCQHCGSTEALSVDHVHPESKGGTLDLSNLQTLCRSCNSKKGARTSE